MGVLVFESHKASGWLAIGTATVLWLGQSTPAAAFSDLTRYAASTEEGGTEGRYFTGSTLDGYGCASCHTGAPGIDVAVSGLPLTGYVPGASYEIALQFQDADPHVALVLEFADEQRNPAGMIGPPDVATIPPAEFCIEEGEMTRPALLPVPTDDGRVMLGVADCGARAVRFIWTAPATSVGPVWMTGGIVNSNEEADPEGDGVTLVRHRLLSEAGQAYVDEVASGCAVAGGLGHHGRRSTSPTGHAGGWLSLVTLGILVARTRHLQRSPTRSPRAQATESST